VVCEDGGPPGAAKDQLRLGSTTFRDRSGVAEPTLRLSVNSVKRLVDRTRWAGRLVDDWPSAIRHELVGRALGRVLAHEIGHFLLAWRRHTPHGLMRAEFGSIELLEHDRRLFVLPADLLPRLQTHLEQLTGRTKTLLAVE
jgi:hypothetical protein